VSLAARVLEQIIKHGEVTRGWLGIEPQELTPELAQSLAVEESGVLIRALVESGPADRAGIMAQGRRRRDRRKAHARHAGAARAHRRARAGSTSKVSVWRDRKIVDVDGNGRQAPPRQVARSSASLPLRGRALRRSGRVGYELPADSVAASSTAAAR
jgi:S1-C subfamily serine protease